MSKPSLSNISRLSFGFLFVYGLGGCNSDSALDRAVDSSAAVDSFPTQRSVDPSVAAPATKDTNPGKSFAEIPFSDLSTVAAAESPPINQRKTVAFDDPRVSRNDFVMRVTPSAREELITQASKPENSYLQVGRVGYSGIDLEYFEFCDVYNQERHYQFRTNGIKILVPLPLVNRLQNSTIDFDPSEKKLKLILADP